MKRMIAISTIAIFAAFMLNGPASAQMMQQKPQGGMMGQGMMGGMMKGMMQGGMMGQMHGKMHGGFDFYLSKAKQLGLTKDQIQKLRALKFEFEKANVQRKAALQLAQLELKELKASENPDPKKVEAKIREVQNKKADLEIALFRAQRRAKSPLTEEQRAKLASMTCPMCGQMHGGMMGGGMMGGMMGGGMMGGVMMGGVMEQFDADGDGSVTPEELRAGLTGKLEEFDADGDGALSLDEFDAMHSALMRQRTVDKFQFLDDDGDGRVTAEEIAKPAKMMERMQKMRQQRMEAMKKRQGGMMKGGPGMGGMGGMGNRDGQGGMMKGGQGRMMQDDDDS